MNNNSITYCRSEGFHDLIFQKNTKAIWEESILFKHNVYTTMFDSIESLKLEIIKATELWINSYPEKERCLTYEEWEKIE